MAFVMKQASDRARGVLVLTHKEMGIVDAESEPVQRAIELLRQRFFLGVHYGWYFHDTLAPKPWVDFHFAPPDTVRFAPGANARVFPLNSSHFIPAFFRDQQLPKQWDIICVTRPVPFKGNQSLLRVLADVKRRRPETRAVVVCAGTKGSRADETDRLWALYRDLFSGEARQDIVFLPFQLEGRPFPFPRRDLAWLYNSSRVFTLFSQKEGGSKAIKEALLCGLPVVLRRDLVGGGLEFAREGNSRLFSNEAEARDAFCHVLDSYPAYRFDTLPLAERASETHTVPRLAAMLEDMFREHGEAWDGAWDHQDLSMKLPSHHPGLIPAELSMGWTSDLRSAEAFVDFCAMLLDRVGGPRLSISREQRLQLRARGLRQKARKTVRLAAYRIKHGLKRVLH